MKIIDQFSQLDFDEKGFVVLELMFEIMNHPENPYQLTHYWNDGMEFLCDTEERAEALADFLESLGFDPHTGYYDPEEDERSGEVDEHTGWYYVDFD